MTRTGATDGDGRKLKSVNYNSLLQDPIRQHNKEKSAVEVVVEAVSSTELRNTLQAADAGPKDSDGLIRVKVHCDIY